MTDAHPPIDLTAFQRDCLRVIERDGPTYGIAIQETLEESYGEINHGRLYPNLDELAEKGLVEKGQLDKRTNNYRLTPRGERAMDDYRAWLRNGIDA